ncbi:FAD-binding oxidoreductase [Mesorhizobium sp. KR9-304]|uniref:FAD-binding oxidoreductase n=1 Tax=Mesorhizobium sp. KR9-304 TaxID=3156614 RepID=UPI0032B4A09F
MRWQTAVVTEIVRRSRAVSSFFFRLPEFVPFAAGQHIIVRLTAPDGYRAQRSYSIASAPETTSHVELAIEKLDDGEVSPFFHEVVEVGDEIELSEPVGGHFIWRTQDGGPVLLIGGGSGIAPFVSMARHRALAGSTAPMLLLFSARTRHDLLFADELAELRDRQDGFDMITTLTREASPPEGISKGRIDAGTIAAALARLPGPVRRIYICGSNPFVENAAQHAIDAGVEPGLIATERYGV